MTKRLRFAHLYPDLLNLYADQGNILTLTRRAEWRGIDVAVHRILHSDKLHLGDYHLVLLGGGSDREQALVGTTLRTYQRDVQQAVAGGLPVLAICGGYQLLGQYYELPNGTKVQGLEVLDMVTRAGAPRLIGNVAIESPECGSVVGFENHGGRTTHRHEPFGTVVHGHGNNGQDKGEGVRYKHVLGTYIHGPLLPKNPAVADFMLGLAMKYAGIERDLTPLDDRLEHSAHEAFRTRKLALPPRH